MALCIECVYANKTKASKYTSKPSIYVIIETKQTCAYVHEQRAAATTSSLFISIGYKQCLLLQPIVINMICVSCSQCKTNQKFNKTIRCVEFLPPTHSLSCYAVCVCVRLLWLAELIARVKTCDQFNRLSHCMRYPKIVYWLICNYWLTRVQAHEKFHDAEQKKTSVNPFNIVLER